MIIVKKHHDCNSYYKYVLKYKLLVDNISIVVRLDSEFIENKNMLAKKTKKAKKWEEKIDRIVIKQFLSIFIKNYFYSYLLVCIILWIIF